MNVLFIFIYSVGLTVILTGLNILVDFIPEEEKLKMAKILMAGGIILILVSLYFL